MADRYSHTEDEDKVICIVNFLLEHGADPYENVSQGYIPELFDMGNASESRMFLVDTFAAHGYNVLPDGVQVDNN